MSRMTRLLCLLPVVIPLLWAAAILVPAGILVPECIPVFVRTHPTLETQRFETPVLGPFHRFLEAVKPAIPPRARTILIGPPSPEWAGLREDHYKCFLFHMLPRPVRAVKNIKDLPDLLDWADYVVVFRLPVLSKKPHNFTLHLDLGTEGKVFRRNRPGP